MKSRVLLHFVVQRSVPLPAYSLPSSPTVPVISSLLRQSTSTIAIIAIPSWFYDPRGSMTLRPPPGGTLVPRVDSRDFFPCRRISRRHPIVSLSLRRRFERSAPFSFHSRTCEPTGIALSSPRRGGISIWTCKFSPSTQRRTALRKGTVLRKRKRE